MSEAQPEPTPVAVPQPSPTAAQIPSQTPPPEEAPEPSIGERQVYIIAGVVIAVIVSMVLISIYLLTLPNTDTEKIRDIFIIMLALEAFVIGVSVIILLVQLARLINLMQNELKPMLESTEITVNNLRGTTEFLTENMVEPVMKLNESIAALRSLLATFRLFR